MTDKCDFQHYALRGIIEKADEHSYDITIGLVEGDIQKPMSLDLCPDRLRELDEKLMAGEMYYLWHVESQHFDDWGVLIQAYFCDEGLYNEWEQAYDKTFDIEFNECRWIAPELTILAPFLKKYRKNANLIELRAGPY